MANEIAKGRAVTVTSAEGKQRYVCVEIWQLFGDTDEFVTVTLRKIDEGKR